MKKVIYGVLLVAILGLTACSNSDKKEASSSSKVEQLESRVNKLEASSSSDKGKEDTSANDILNIFKSNKLPVFNEFPTNKSELDDLNTGITSQTSFYFKQQENDGESDITNLIIVAVGKNQQAKNQYVENLESANKNSDGRPVTFRYAVNEKLNGILSVGSAIPEEDFNKYKEVFESIN